ncbi:uncharacterized protein LOC129787370 [Lutzomyia longipalpis]|uniref:uncharacterized protein LOC129787370 n=1 Tax=Lutzomyia longipalpis TaxID=7200 RepID=UPI0024844F1E|nr:uncharacterized protein LOC129787370 [Lutzomyia longipalpis]
MDRKPFRTHFEGEHSANAAGPSRPPRPPGSRIPYFPIFTREEDKVPFLTGAMPESKKATLLNKLIPGFVLHDMPHEGINLMLTILKFDKNFPNPPDDALALFGITKKRARKAAQSAQSSSGDPKPGPSTK